MSILIILVIDSTVFMSMTASKCSINGDIPVDVWGWSPSDAACSSISVAGSGVHWNEPPASLVGSDELLAHGCQCGVELPQTPIDPAEYATKSQLLPALCCVSPHSPHLKYCLPQCSIWTIKKWQIRYKLGVLWFLKLCC